MSAYPPAFLAAVATLLRDEGGYVDNPADSGGKTKFGISQRSYPNLDIANLTQVAATDIYFRDFWRPFEWERLPDAIAAKLFNLAVDMGHTNAIRCLQRALHACGNPVAGDGILGQMTIDAAHTCEMGVKILNPGMPTPLLSAIRSEAASYYRDLAARENRDEVFLKGWLKRAYE